VPQPTLFEELLMMRACAGTYNRNGKSTGNRMGVQAAGSAELSLGAAMLAELAVNGRIQVGHAGPTERRPRPNRDTLPGTDHTPLGDLETDTALEDAATMRDRCVGKAITMTAPSLRPASAQRWEAKAGLR
jgi:hypothetical protein